MSEPLFVAMPEPAKADVGLGTEEVKKEAVRFVTPASARELRELALEPSLPASPTTGDAVGVGVGARLNPSNAAAYDSRTDTGQQSEGDEGATSGGAPDERGLAGDG